MSHAHTNVWRPRRFRAFVTNQYFENRDEYDSVGQRQQHTFEAYVQENLSMLKAQFKQQRQLVKTQQSSAAKSLIRLEKIR
jgi:hypothetical protein